MAEAFKHLINAARVHEAGDHLARAWAGFDRAAFERQAVQGLEALELKARAMHVADALEATLPADFHQAATIIETALAPPGVGDALGFASSDAGLAGWICWPLGEFIARRGLPHPERAFTALHALTQRFSAEFAIRPLLLAHPDIGARTLLHWTTDPSAHVRRLASEGSRPRLPWGLQLKPLIADPSPMLPVLRALQDDDSAYVRRSVANHLNDIAKDHPEQIVAWLAEHLPDAPPLRRALLRHASRSLIKQGHAGVLKAWGIGGKFRGSATVSLSAKGLKMGEAITLRATLISSARTTQLVAVDYVVHHMRANGQTRPKVFKGWQLSLPAGAEHSLIKSHSFRALTTRRYYAGAHRLELQVNGQVVAAGDFQLLE